MSNPFRRLGSGKLSSVTAARRRRLVRGGALALAASCISIAAGGEPSCTPGLVPGFGPIFSANGDIYALVYFDDGAGDGPALYAGGAFTMIAGVAADGMARWDGKAWSEVGGGVNGTVYAFTIAEGTAQKGPSLYVGGSFTMAGDVEVNRVAQWDGTSWSALGAGIDHGTVFSLIPVDGDEGESGEIYAGGSFQDGGPPTSNVVRWTGTSWQFVGTGAWEGDVAAMVVFDDGAGGGPSLIVGGSFGVVGGVNARDVARWNGGVWTAMGEGFTASLDRVRALAVYDDGSGSGAELYAGGSLTQSGVQPLVNLAKWNGSQWIAAGSGTAPPIYALTVFDDGSTGAPALYVGRSSPPGIARWDGMTWSVPPTDPDAPAAAVHAFAVQDGGGNGPSALLMGSEVGGSATELSSRVSRWDGNEWSSLGSGLNQNVLATLRATPTPDGPEILYVGGAFTSVGGLPHSYIASWDGTSFSSLDGGMNGPVHALAWYDDGSGSGPALYAAGDFTIAGGVPANRVAKWDGKAWSALGAGLDGVANALAVLDLEQGDGPELFVGGNFSIAGGELARSIARWNGTTWSKLGFIGIFGTVKTLKAYAGDPFSGLGAAPALFVGGSFAHVDGIFMYSLTKWDGVSFSAIGDGIDPVIGNDITEIEIFDDGTGAGSVLVLVAYEFTVRGWSMSSPIFWNGADWWHEPLHRINTLAVLDDGTGGGSALYAGGGTMSPGTSQAQYRRVAKFVGSTWVDLVSHLSGPVLVLDSRAGSPGRPPVLDIAGNFPLSPLGDSYLMHWQGCAEEAIIPGDANGDGVVDGNDLALVLGQWGPCPGCSADLNGDGVVNGNDLSIVLGHWS